MIVLAREISNVDNMITSPVNYNKHFDKLAYFIQARNIKNTNIIKMARVDRNKTAQVIQACENFNKEF